MYQNNNVGDDKIGRQQVAENVFTESPRLQSLCEAAAGGPQEEAEVAGAVEPSLTLDRKYQSLPSSR